MTDKNYHHRANKMMMMMMTNVSVFGYNLQNWLVAFDKTEYQLSLFLSKPTTYNRRNGLSECNRVTWNNQSETSVADA